MAESITDVAAFILNRTGTITTMKLHKLAFYAQAEHLVKHQGAPLFPEDFYAWRSGRCKLVCSRTHGLVTKASSKSHATTERGRFYARSTSGASRTSSSLGLHPKRVDLGRG